MSLWLNRESSDGRRSIFAVEGLAPLVLGTLTLVVAVAVYFARSCA
jgi:hypothetical protein